MTVLYAPWMPEGPRKSLDTNGVLLFVGASVLCAPWSPAGPGKSLDTNDVLLFVGALLSWRPVLANRRILGVIGEGFVCSVVAGGAQKIAGY